MSLLTNALTIQTKKPGKDFAPSSEEIELAIAWAQGKVATVQAESALVNSGSVKKNGTPGYLSAVLKFAVKSGVLVVA